MQLKIEVSRHAVEYPIATQSICDIRGAPNGREGIISVPIHTHTFDMASEKFMILDPAYRKLQKLKELVREENASSKISAGIDEAIDLLKVSVTSAKCITGIKSHGFCICYFHILSIHFAPEI